MSHWLKRIGIPLLTLILGWNLGAAYVQGGMPRMPVMDTPVTGSGAVATDPEKQVDISLMWRVWGLLLQNYIEPSKLQSQPMLYGAVTGMVNAVGDPYTAFMTPKENTDFREGLAGTLKGIGAELMVRDGLVTIVTPIKQSPAERAGLLPDDVIAEVDGTSTEGQSLGEVVGRIRGQEGTTVTLAVARKDKPDLLTFTITREEIHIPSVESRIITEGTAQIGYVALNQFGEGSVQEVRQALQSFRQLGRGAQVTGLIFDVRQNGGGYLDGAVEIASLFMKQGTVVTVEQRGQAPVRRDVDGRPVFPDIPLVLLQNQGSASASEIVAGALQDNKRATVIGMQSFGKGTVQEVIDLPDGSSLRVTVARWLTPSGKDLGKEGVHPDYIVDRTGEDIVAKRDPQLDAAVEWLRTGTVSSAKATTAKNESL